jgi:hypothetical protein
MTISRDFLAIQQDALDIVFTDIAIEHALDRVNPVYELQFESVKQLISFPTKHEGNRAVADVDQRLRHAVAPRARADRRAF